MTNSNSYSEETSTSFFFGTKNAQHCLPTPTRTLLSHYCTFCSNCDFMEFHWMSHCLFTSSTCNDSHKVKEKKELKQCWDFPLWQKEWTVPAKKTHILSLLLQKLDLLFIHLHITRLGRGFLCRFSSLRATQNIPQSSTHLDVSKSPVTKDCMTVFD